MSVAFGLWFKSVWWAYGAKYPHFRQLDDIVYSVKLGAIARPFWGFATGSVKISIGLMLLRFQQAKRWKAVIWAMIALNVVLIILVGIVTLFQCRPYSAMWDFRNDIRRERCWDNTMHGAILYSSSVCNVLTDVVFSLLPLTFLCKIRCPLSEKVVIGEIGRASGRERVF